MEENAYTRKDRKPSSVYLFHHKVITASADYYIIQAVVLDVVLDGITELLIRCGE